MNYFIIKCKEEFIFGICVFSSQLKERILYVSSFDRWLWSDKEIQNVSSYLLLGIVLIVLEYYKKFEK
jgi:hypothetical protein